MKQHLTVLMAHIRHKMKTPGRNKLQPGDFTG